VVQEQARLGMDYNRAPIMLAGCRGWPEGHHTTAAVVAASSFYQDSLPPYLHDSLGHMLGALALDCHIRVDLAGMCQTKQSGRCAGANLGVC
jgi:hypothetical protein